MAGIYFKIRALYKRTHKGELIEQTGSDAARRALECCIAMQRGIAPSRVLKEGSFTFTSTEFNYTATEPQDVNTGVRLCEATSLGSTFVRGILMNIYGESAHMNTWSALLKEEIRSRRDYHEILAFLEATISYRRVQRIPVTDEVTLRAQLKLTSAYRRYMGVDAKMLCLKAGKAGIHAVSHRSSVIHPASGIAAAASQVSDTAPLKVEIDEDEYMAMIFLASQHAIKEPIKLPKELEAQVSPLADPITKLFVDTLVSPHPLEDGWGEEGSAYFKETLHYFLRRDIPIQFCLPAFPCKSTNPRKTSSRGPDGAEVEAFYLMHEFCTKIREIYPPGIDFIIVSDGHVFSDCVGVDDDQVYKYTDAVEELSDKLYSKFSVSGRESPIRFLDLRDMFYGQDGELLHSAHKTEWTVEENYRPITTKIELKDETCRNLMLRSCGWSTAQLAKKIKDGLDDDIVATYRGFACFMRDDLAASPDFKDLSNKKRRTLADKVAKEMLKRNQAYSRLVELILPRALRISIHQHKNDGPKFAINTLPKEKFKAIQSLKDISSNEDSARDTIEHEAHIPTPWHNVLIEVEGHTRAYIGKSGIVLGEIENPASAYSCEYRDDGRGARWFLRHRLNPGDVTEGGCCGLEG